MAACLVRSRAAARFPALRSSRRNRETFDRLGSGAQRPREIAAATFALQLLAPPDPPRSVELRVSAVDEGEALLLEQSLERELGERLLEDGHRLVPAGAPARVRVWIHVGSEVTTIEVRGRERRVEPVPSGARELVGLEIQQLTSALIDEVGPAELDAAPGEALVLELVGRDDPPLRAALQTGLLARGHALAREPAPGDLRVCIDLAAGDAGVTLLDAAQACPAALPSEPASASEAPELVRERLLDRTQALLDAHVAAETSTPSTTPSAASDEQPLAEPEAHAGEQPPTRPRTSRHALALTAHAGGLARSGGPLDPLFGAGLRAGRRRGLGGGLEASLVPSRATDLRVLETTAHALFDGRIAFARRGAVAGIVVLGLLAGVHLHRYQQTAQNGARATLASPSLATVARVALLRGGLLVFGGLRAGWSGGRWVHLDAGKASWRRSASFVGLELGVGWDWAVRR